MKHDEIRRGTLFVLLLLLSLYIYFFTLIILNSSTQVLLLFYKCPKAIIFIYYGGIDLIKLLIAFNDPP